MRVAVAKKIAAENGMSLEYNNDMRLYILKDKEQGWPDQFFPHQLHHQAAQGIQCQGQGRFHLHQGQEQGRQVAQVSNLTGSRYGFL